MSYNRDAPYFPPPPGQGGVTPPAPPRPGPSSTGQYTSQGIDTRYNNPQPQNYPPQTSYKGPPDSTANYVPPLPPRETHPLYGTNYKAPQQNPPHGGYQMNTSNQYTSGIPANPPNYSQGYHGYPGAPPLGEQPPQGYLQAPQSTNSYAMPPPPVSPGVHYAIAPPPAAGPPVQPYSYPQSTYQQYGAPNADKPALHHYQGNYPVYQSTSSNPALSPGKPSQNPGQTYMAPPQVVYGHQPSYNEPPSAPFVSPEPVQSPQAMPPTPARPPLANVEDVSSMLDQLNIKAPPHPPRPAPEIRDDLEPEEWTRLVPRVSETGPPNQVLFECPESRELDYETSWYRLPDTPDILICTRCHDMYIVRTQLSGLFERIQRSTGKCSFNVPRLTRVLFPEARRTGEIRPVIDYMTKRRGIPNCKEQQGATSHEGIKWFRLAGNEIDDFVACEACYEDTVLATSFGKNFVSSDIVQLADQTWVCDLCIPFIKRALLKFSRRPNGWNTWVTAAAKRLRLPACDGNGVPESSRQWVRPRRKVHDLAFCETCYLDKVALTALEHDFEYVVNQKSSTSPSLAGLLLGQKADQGELWLCDASKTSILVALDAAVCRKDFNVFWKAANIAMSSPGCTEQGISDGTWYTLDGGCDGFTVCAGCYAGFFETWELGRFFQKVKLGGSSPVLCSYNPAHPRFAQYVYRQAEAIEIGIWSRFSNFVREWASVPKCPRDNLTENLRWYGYGDCTICPECYNTYCLPTKSALGSSLEVPLKNAFIAKTRMCSMYSPRMRTKWKEACVKGSPTELIEFSRLRMEVYGQTVIKIGAMRQMQLLQARQAMHAGSLSIMYQGMEGTRILSGTTDGYLHGNSNLGWHATQEGATSAALMNQMRTGLSQSSSPNTAMTIMQLSMQWAQVE
jgi:hypothetical protein